MKLKLLFITIAFFVGVGSWGQILIPSSTPVTENFNGMGNSSAAVLPTGWKMTAAGETSPTWAAAGNFTATLLQASTGTPSTGSSYNWGNGTTTTDRAPGFMTSSNYSSPNTIMAFYKNSSGDQINDLAVTFDYERYRINTAACSITFFTSTDGLNWIARTAGDSGAFTTATNEYNFSTGTVISKSVTLTGINIANNSNFYLRWSFNTTGSNSQGVGLDNVSLTATLAIAGPTITSSPATLTGFTYVYGSGPSTEQSFTVSGTSLTNNLVVTPPANYEISNTSGSGFVSSPSTLSFTPSFGTVTSKTIYTRLKAGLSVASYNSEVTNITSTGATAKTITCSGNVTAKPLTVSGYTGTNKVYDRLTTATLAGTGTLVGIVGSDVVSLSGTATGTFATKNVGVGKTITITGLSLTGANAGNYTLTAPTATATITAKPLTVTGAAATPKVYSAANAATITGSTLVGVVDGDTVTISGTGTFATVNVGTGIAVTSTQTLSGTDSANYTVTLPSGLSANITAKPLIITGISANNKVYDGNTTASLTGTATLSGVIAADVPNITLNTASVVANFVDNVIGTGKAVTVTGYTITGTSSGNYTLSQPSGLTANITASTESDLVVTGTQPATISSLVNNAAPLSSSTGVEVLQFKVRDGGSDLTDADTLPTILTSFTIAQDANSVTTWTDAILTVALFDGNTFIKTGAVTASQIQFTGLNITSADNTEKILSIRLSLKNPLGADAFDGEYFGFSISNANTTFSATGSGEASFTAVANNTGTNIIDVTATKLLFITQPTNTAINTGMNSVIVKAYDANNNLDLSYTGTISMTSTGTENAIAPKAATDGVASFSGITHTMIGTGLTLSATATGLSAATSSTFDIVISTNLSPGDLAVLSVNTAGTNGDQIAFVCFTNIASDTKLYLTDNGYERKTAGEWGNTEGVITIKRIGPSLPQGTIIVIESNVGNNNINLGTKFNVFVCGINDNANWTRGFEGGGSGFNLNSNDDIWIMQGGTWSDGTTGSHNAAYSGTVLYGWTESGWNIAPGGFSETTAWSTLYQNLECYNTVAPVGDGKVKFNDPVNPDFSTLTNGKLDWIALINTASNWDTYTTNSDYDSLGYNYIGSATCPTMTIAGNTYVNGKWTGKKDTNWFNCGNWDTLVVPDETVDVQVGDNTFNRQAIVDAAAPFASSQGSIAKAKNLTITGEKVQVTSSSNNKLEVHGDLSITTAGELDMSDGTSGTPDGQLYLSGNWSNYQEAKFNQGESTIHFVGTSPQTVVCVDNTEKFFNVNLDNANNPFTTDSFNSDLIAEGSLTLSNGTDLTVLSGHYALAAKNLTVGTGSVFVIESTGSLIQTDDTGINSNSGTINVIKTTTPFEKYDYTYWSTPIVSTNIETTFATMQPFWRIDNAYEFFPANYSDKDNDGFDDNHDDWFFATDMIPGKGYIIMVPESQIPDPPVTSAKVIFSGNVNNGVIETPIALTPVNIPTGVDDANDDFNLVGNPYPSAISADEFIKANISTNGTAFNTIEGTLYFWTHKNDLSANNIGPDAFNYTQDDYAVYTLAGGTGTSASISSMGNTNTIVNSVPAGYIASGQGFFVEAVNSGTLLFNNAMRVGLPATANSQFFKSMPKKSKIASKDRIWLNLENSLGMFSQQLVGYFENTTLGHDNGYDGLLSDAGNYVAFYSFIDDKTYKIQGRAEYNENDQVRLGYFSAVAGTFNINIDSKEGVFSNSNTNVYLEDKLLNVIYDLNQAPYTFTTEKGTFNDRFFLRYTNKTLGTANFETPENQVLVSNKNKQIKINSAVETIDKVFVYDLLGRQIFKKEKVNSNEFSLLNLVSSQQTLLVKVRLQNGETVTKKIIY